MNVNTPRDKAIRKRRLRVVIDIDVPARDWNRRKLNHQAVSLGEAATRLFNVNLLDSAEVVYCATEEMEIKS